MKIEDIKFKAKRLDTREWVKGDLVHSTNYIGICRYHPNNTFPDVPVVYKVDSDTVCQFTGLKDCDGNEIWENDILLNVTNDSPNGTVVFKYGAFCLLAKNGRDFCIALTYLLSEKDSLNRFKVIGNKYDKKIVDY